MSRHKHLTGTFVFGRVDGGDADDPKHQFDLIFKLLSRSYQGTVPASSSGEKAEMEQLPFPVVLSFEERSGESPMAAIEQKLKALFRRLVDSAALLPHPIGVGARIVAALDDFINKDPNAVEASDLKDVAVEKPDALEWERIGGVLSKWDPDAFANLDLARLTRERWQEFLRRLGEGAAPPAPPADVGLPAPPPAPAPAPPPAAPPAPALVAAPVPEPPPFELTQLMGWLTTQKGQSGTYGFDLEGVTRFPDDAVEYGTWARLDVFGPDGSQMLTRHVDYQTLAVWLGESGQDDLEVDIVPTRELRTALATPSTVSRDVRTVSGRLWFSDGRPFGARTLAVYVKPALARLIDDCCPPEEFEFKGCCGDPLENVPVMQIPQALAVTQTDQGGYFEFSYTSDKPLDSHYALLQVSGVAMPVALELRYDDASASFPKPVLLQVDSGLILPEPGSAKRIDWLGDDKDDCGCRGLDFSEPNRALDEFKMDIIVRTTDPMVVRRRIDISKDVQEKLPAPDDRSLRPSDSGINRNFRTVLSREHPVEWDDDPLVAQAVAISHGRILTISQVWRADGYSLGDLRYSLPLAPLQKKNIAVIDWEREDLLRMESTQDYRESLYNFVGRERDISEIVNTALNESIAGRSESGGSSRSAGGGFSLGPFAFGGASGGSSSAWSTSNQNSTRTLAANFMNKLRDQTVQSANALRSQRVTTVQQVHQSETARVVTETVANRNACHAITVQYFEVLRHFRVDHELAAVRECLYIPLPLSAFTSAKALRWRQALHKYLPAGLRDALDACERLAANTYGAANTYADEELTCLTGSIDLTLDFPLPPTPLEEGSAWNTYLGVVFDSASPLPALVGELKRISEVKRSKLFETKIAPALAKKLTDSLRLVGMVNGNEQDLGMEANLVSSYRAGERHKIVFTERAGIGALRIKRRDLTAVKIKTSATIPEFDTVLLHGGDFVLATEHLETRLATAAADKNTLSQSGETQLALPLRAHEQQNRQHDDEVARTRLLAHLNENIEYYHKAIWWTMDPDRRFTLLDGYVAPNAGGRSVASVVENRLVAIIGNSLVMPVAPGIRLDYFDETAASGEMPRQDKDEDWLLARYRPLIPNPSTQIAVPTRGVFAESMMGNCNGCEKIDDSRNWQYWQHPLPDEPTAIEPISLDSRARDIPVAQPPPMPGATVINQVASQIPQAPDPIGLAAAIAAITNGSAFRDATGLAGTQQNSREALAQSYATTTRFGELGAELSKKQMDAAIDAMKMVVSAYTGIPMLGGSGGGGGEGSSVKKSIAADAAAGRITTQKAQELTAEVNKRLVDSLGGGETASLPDVQEVRDAITKGRDEGSPISISRGDSSVNIGEPTRPPAGSSRGGLSSLWPFGSRERSRQRRVDPVAPALPTLVIEIVTAIRDVGGATQVGEKSRQILILNCAKRTLTKPEPTLGKTMLPFGVTLDAVRTKFRADLDRNTLDDDVFAFDVLGQTASGVRIMPDIDYRLKFSVDTKSRRLHITGEHDGYPSYSIILDGKVVYDYEQNLFEESISSLMGTGDVNVATTVRF